METITFADIESEAQHRYADPEFIKIIRISQLITEYHSIYMKKEEVVVMMMTTTRDTLIYLKISPSCTRCTGC